MGNSTVLCFLAQREPFRLPVVRLKKACPEVASNIRTTKCDIISFIVLRSDIGDLLRGFFFVKAANQRLWNVNLGKELMS